MKQTHYKYKNMDLADMSKRQLIRAFIEVVEERDAAMQKTKERMTKMVESCKQIYSQKGLAITNINEEGEIEYTEE